MFTECIDTKCCKVYHGLVGNGGELMDTKAISSKLVSLRGPKTQEEIAKGIGVTRSAYANYEQGIRIPKDDVKVAIAKYYGMEVGSIFFD